jgi:hypothetical protein
MRSDPDQPTPTRVTAPDREEDNRALTHLLRFTRARKYQIQGLKVKRTPPACAKAI